MENIKNAVIGTIITVIIGGTAYSINQNDIIKNFADDTGLTNEQAEQYVNKVSKDELVAWKEIGSQFVNDGQKTLTAADNIDCINYEYEWETLNLPCSKGKTQMVKLSEDWISLGQAYIKLDSEPSSEYNIKRTIQLINLVNYDLTLEVIKSIYDQPTITKEMQANSYNKALLQTVLDDHYKNK